MSTRRIIPVAQPRHTAPDMRTRAAKVAAAMKRCGIERSARVSFGRPCIAGTGIPVALLAERFKAGETIAAIAGDYDGVEPADIENAIRFWCLYPKSDLESFWSPMSEKQRSLPRRRK